MEHTLSFLLKLLLILFGIPVAAFTAPFFFVATVLKSVVAFGMFAVSSVALACNPWRYRRVWPDVRLILLVLALGLSYIAAVLAAPVLTVGYIALFMYRLCHTAVVGYDVDETIYEALVRGVRVSWSAMSNVFMESTIPWLHSVCGISLRVDPHNHPGIVPCALNAYTPAPFFRFVKWLIGGYHEFYADAGEATEHYLFASEGKVVSGNGNGNEYITSQVLDYTGTTVGVLLFSRQDGTIGFYKQATLLSQGDVDGDGKISDVEPVVMYQNGVKFDTVISSPEVPHSLKTAHTDQQSQAPLADDDKFGGKQLEQLEENIEDGVVNKVKDLMAQNSASKLCVPTESFWSHYVHQHMLYEIDQMFNTHRAHVNLYTIVMRSLDLIGSFIEGVLVGGLTWPLYLPWILYWTFIKYPCSMIHKLWRNMHCMFGFLHLLSFVAFYSTVGWCWALMCYSVGSLFGAMYLWGHYFFMGKSGIAAFSGYMMLEWPRSW